VTREFEVARAPGARASARFGLTRFARSAAAGDFSAEMDLKRRCNRASIFGCLLWSFLLRTVAEHILSAYARARVNAHGHGTTKAEH
jgi:hypothetical protein